MKGRHLGLNAAGVKSYDQLTDALDALNRAGRQTPCAGRAADFTPVLCRQCPVQRLCHDHGTRYEQTGIWGGSKAGRNSNQ